MPSTPPDPRRPDPGLGVFETLLARDSRIQALGRHLDRLAASVAALYDASLPDSLAEELRRRADAPGERRLRVDLVPSPSGNGLHTQISSSVLPGDRHGAVACRPLRIAGGLGAHKWVDRRLIEASGEVTALIVDHDDELLEAAFANVFVLAGRRLTTPPADGRLLAGVMRGVLLEAAPRLGLEPVQAPLSLACARAADAILLTSSLRHAVPAALTGARPPASELAARIRRELAGRHWE
jgi:branched-subunit amino acid aminotransferase/4-amino-4-deoxychorismate lyase